MSSFCHLLICLQDGDETVIYNSALALDALQHTFSRFPRIIGKGDYAAVMVKITDPRSSDKLLRQKLATLLMKPLPEQPVVSLDSLNPQAPFDSLIVLDRHVDMITPLLTQLTYQGLIDELIGIKNCEHLQRFAIMRSSHSFF